MNQCFFLAELQTSYTMNSSLLALFCCFTASFGFDFFDWNSFFEPQDADCFTTPWQKGKCFLDGDKLRRQHHRSIIHEKGNGKPCSNYDTIKTDDDCDMLDYMADVLRNNIMQETPDGGLSRSLPFGTVNKQQDFEPLCSKDIKDSSGVRLLGRDCDDTRKKRSVVDVKLRTRRQVIGNVRKHRDVLFLIDESLSVTATHFKKEVNLAKAIINSLCGALNLESQKTRVAVNTFDYIVHEYLKFDTTFEKTGVANVLDKIVFNERTGWSTCMTNSLKLADNKTFTLAYGAREFNRDTSEGMIILITDGCANCASDAELKAVAERLAKRRITIVVLYVAPATSYGERCALKMKNLASGTHCYQVLRFPSWDDVVKFTDRFVRGPCMDRWRFAPATCV